MGVNFQWKGIIHSAYCHGLPYLDWNCTEQLALAGSVKSWPGT